MGFLPLISSRPFSVSLGASATRFSLVPVLWLRQELGARKNRKFGITVTYQGFFSTITHRGGFAGTLRRREYKALGIVDSLISLLCICHVFNKEKKIA